jgi:hypothetical protein
MYRPGKGRQSWCCRQMLILSRMHKWPASRTGVDDEGEYPPIVCATRVVLTGLLGRCTFNSCWTRLVIYHRHIVEFDFRSSGTTSICRHCMQ